MRVAEVLDNGNEIVVVEPNEEAYNFTGWEAKSFSQCKGLDLFGEYDGKKCVLYITAEQMKWLVRQATHVFPE